MSWFNILKKNGGWTGELSDKKKGTFEGHS